MERGSGSGAVVPPGPAPSPSSPGSAPPKAAERSGRFHDRRLPARFQPLSGTFWIILCVALFFAVVGVSVAGLLGFSRSSAQAVRLALQGQPGAPGNQSAVVDRARSTVTFYVTSQSNRSAAVLYDGENGHVCYKPAAPRACYLRAMDARDRQHLQAALDASEHAAEPFHSNRTRRSREFLAVQAGAEVDPAGLGPAVRALCEQRSILPARHSPGPGRQRLIYLCIDICFPSNICVSICFYYLPE